jgi:hypothetical protein
MRIAADCFAAFFLRGLECGQQTLGEIALAGFVRARHGVPHRVVLHEIRLHGVLRAVMISGSGDALRTRVRGDAPLRIDHRHLADGLLRVGGDQRGERLGRCLPRLHERQAQRSVRLFGERLRGHRAHTGFRPCDVRADREPVRLHRDAELAAHRVARHDGISVHRPLDADRAVFRSRAHRAESEQHYQRPEPDHPSHA